jgi:translation initiation factor IF-3
MNFKFYTIAVSYRRGRNRSNAPKREPKQKINERIRAEEVRVVDEQGEMIGVMPTKEALEKAKEIGVDLVEISPNAKPPVCKIIDFGKFLYNEQTKEKAQKRATKSHEIKGIRLSFRIGPGDMDRQRKKAEEFLQDQHPVRVQMVMRGREKAHKHLAVLKMKDFLETLKASGIVEQEPKFSGFQIVSVLKPVPKNAQ